MRPQNTRSLPKPLTAESLEMLALRYVERFATTEAKLTRYLERKLRERGWAGEAPADTVRIVGRLASLHYVDDRQFGEARARGLQRRGYGKRRIDGDLRAAGLADTMRAGIIDEVDARAAALAFARRKRLGPYGKGDDDPKTRQRQFAQMLRAGHEPRLAAEILALRELPAEFD